MSRRLRSHPRWAGIIGRSRTARGLPLVAYSLVSAALAVGIANLVILWLGAGHELDWLALLIVMVLVSGWFASPVLRWLSSKRP